MVNELSRRFEVLDDPVDKKEKQKIVDHFTRQLVNSGYNHGQTFNIITSSLKGIKRKLGRRRKKMARNIET